MQPEEESSIERLKRRLYSRNERLVPKDKRTPVEPHDTPVPTNWGEEKTFNISPETMVRKNNAFFNKFLLGSLIFFFLALAVAIFIFYGGINMISSNNLDIQITAPTSVSSGEELDMGLSIVNGNRTDLEAVELYVDYPDGASTVGDSSQTITHDKIDLGTISSGGNKNYTLRTLLFGQKDLIKTFTFRVEYQVKGSNATFSKQKTYDIVIGSSPVLINVNYPQEVNSGQDVTLSIDVTSNSSVPLKNTLVRVEYPYGFTYESSNIRPLASSSVWNIGDLKNGDKKTLTVTGSIVGQDQEDRSFRISAGSQSVPGSPNFDTSLADSTITLGIRKSFFGLDVSTLSGGSVTSPGQPVSLVIKWQNTLPDKILNNSVQVTMSGNALDRSRVNPDDGGFYQSVNNQVLWDKNSTSILSSLMPGDMGQIGLNLASIPVGVQLNSLRNPHIDLHIVMTGDRSGTDTTTVSSNVDVTIKVSSTVNLSAQSFRSSGPFANSGPIPPKADNESTYTITWALTNTTNDLTGASVTATLPPGVIWTGQTSPSTEKITYDPNSRTVSWSVGNVSAGVGFIYSPKTVSFQVGITPSVNQVGSEAPLVTASKFTAIDSYTMQAMNISTLPVSTKFSDPSFSSGQEIVKQ